MLRRVRNATRRGRLPDSPTSGTWYEIKNRVDGGRAVIDVYGEIGFYGVEAAAFISDLRDLTASDIELHLNSPGGDVYDGIAIYNALVDHPARIEVRIDGLAASIASIIAQAGDRIVIAPNAQMMIHDAWGLTIGNAADHRHAAEELDRHSDNLASIYATRSGQGTTRAWRKVMEAETWYSADEAVTAGLADEVAKQGKRGEDPAAMWAAALSGYRFQGRAAAPTPMNAVDDDPTEPPTQANDPAPQPPTATGETGPETLVASNGPEGEEGPAGVELETPPADLPPVTPETVLAAIARHTPMTPEPAIQPDVVGAAVAAAASTIAARPVSSAEMVLAATRAAAQLPPPTAPAAPTPSNNPTPIEEIRRSYLEVLNP